MRCYNKFEAESLNYKQFEANDIKKLLGIDKNKLFYWIKTYRLLKPEIEEASGTGKRSKFSLKNLLELAAIKEMLNLGFDLNSVKKIKNKMDSEKIFAHILEDKHKEITALYINRSGNKIILDLRLPIPDPYSDGDQMIPNWIPDDSFLDPKKYIAIRLEIGKLAYDLIKKVESY